MLVPSWNLRHFSSTLNISFRASRCEVRLLSRAFGCWGRRCSFALDTEEDLSALCDPRIRRHGRQAGWIEGRRDGDLTDTSNFLMQPFCNSREETGCSPFYPMNQHDPIFAYKPSQLSLLPLAPNNSDGLIKEFTSSTFPPRQGTGFDFLRCSTTLQEMRKLKISPSSCYAFVVFCEPFNRSFIADGESVWITSSLVSSSFGFGVLEI